MSRAAAVMQQPGNGPDAELAQPIEPDIRPLEERVAPPVRRHPLPEERVSNGLDAKSRKAVEIFGANVVSRSHDLVEILVADPVHRALDTAPDFHHGSGTEVGTVPVTGNDSPMFALLVRDGRADMERAISACIRAHVRSHDCMAR